MITELTEAQKARFPEFVKRWTDIGLCTEPANRPLAEEGIREAYRLAGLEEPKEIRWCGSPFSMDVARATKQVEEDLEDLLVEACEGTSREARQDAAAIIAEKVCAAAMTADTAKAKFTLSLIKGLGLTPGQTAIVKKFNTDQAIAKRVWSNVETGVWNSGYGQHDAHWLGFYDYFREVCGLEKETEKLAGLWKIAKSAGWFFPHENICWVSERHNILHRNEAGQLHCENGPALAYPDGFEIYSLNGIRMKKEHVMTPSSKMDPKLVLSETNVDIRRELLRKIGIERFTQVAAVKVLDTMGTYELLSIELSEDIKDARYLKMTNPSVGCFHVEAVAPECNTCQQAINWRHGDINTNWYPEVLT